MVDCEARPEARCLRKKFVRSGNVRGASGVREVFCPTYRYRRRQEVIGEGVVCSHWPSDLRDVNAVAAHRLFVHIHHGFHAPLEYWVPLIACLC